MASIKKLLILLITGLFISPVFSAPLFPPLTGRVVDEAGILNPSEKSKIESVLATEESKTGNQVVVLTLNSLNGYEIRDYGVQLGRHWGIGQKDKNNGAILIVSMQEHKISIEVGYGLEGKLTDAASKTIIEGIISPYFKQNNFYEGILNGVTAIINVIDDSPITEGVSTLKTTHKKKSPNWISILILLFIIWLVAGRGSGRGGGFRRGGGFYGGFPGGGGSFGGGGGGFSGGGGSFGGGGASGSW